MILADGLAKDYPTPATARDLLRLRLRGPRVTALVDASFEVRAGEIVCVLGPNGAGKSTLLKCLAGLVLPTRGRFRVAGHERAGAPLRRDAVYVTGDPRSFSWRLTGRQNLAFFAALHGYARAEAARRVEELLARVGLLGEAADRRVATYSSGMRQRLALARGFLGRPRVFLLDEPTAGLDPRGARELRALVRELQGEGTAVLLATHTVEEARELADRALVLDAGRVRYAGPVAGAVEAAGG